MTTPHGPAGPLLPEAVRTFIERYSHGNRSMALALVALITSARDGHATVNDVAIRYRDEHIAVVREEGGDAERVAGNLGLDEVRVFLARTIFPRLASDGFLVLPQGDLSSPDAVVRIPDQYWDRLAAVQRDVQRLEVASAVRQTGEFTAVSARATAEREAAQRAAAERAASGAEKRSRSTLEARGLVKTYRRRRVVNDVALRLQQGEIVGLLGPNGAGKTTTFYMIVGLIQPQEGHIVLDNEDITEMPMYRRARRGIGYLSQEPSVFRKLSVEDNILAILETLKLSGEERKRRLERLLDELSIKHLRQSKAYALSGGERRRLEITRALVTEPKFMMLDEPFAGVDPIAVHDIQQIVANLRNRNIGVLISDHNVEQTLDIVDRAYIMFDGQVKVSGTVRELVFDDTVARIYLGPTLTARLRSRYSALESGSPVGIGGNGGNGGAHA